jgi:serine/threonine protein kinase
MEAMAMPPANPDHDREGALLNAVLELPPAERTAFLERECVSEAALRHRLEILLQAHDQAGTFLLKSPAGAVQARAPGAGSGGPGDTLRLTTVPGQPGDRVGRYKLLEQIGEGGCGVVYVAEQEEPVRRRVALKVIKLGMDTRSVIARFEAERQALAMMDHPNIAKVFDAGMTGGEEPETRNPKSEANPKSESRKQNSEIPAGRPYFVMELVRGIKITDYCEQHNLSTAQRLDLFIQVCHAIQHAHQKGIIHRDIKPSNILVTVNDGAPVPKVIDFGIAKATNQQRLTDKTVYTAFDQFIGTPAYMSPEQAEMTSLDIDTRSDIYALGVLLYELLTGETPFDPKTLLAAGLDEMRRIIREQEPVRPSTRLRQTQSAPPVSPKAPLASRLSPLASDLDWIVMKCLEKDRTRRYETANGLASDVERHLQHEPVMARPPSTVYRARKFLRRNRVMVTEAALLVCLVVFSTAGAFLWLRHTRVQWAKNQAVPEVERLLEQGAVTWDYAKARQALQLGQKASRYLPDEPRLKKALEACSGIWSMKSDPPGARVSIKPYDDQNANWNALGQTPLPNITLARGFYLVRFEKTGYEPVEAVCGLSGGELSRKLDPAGTLPPGMVRVTGRNVAIAGIGEVPAFFIDKCEVSHRQFKEFVDAGGYGNPRHWKQPFIRDGRTLTWEEAMSLFRDTTGRPGPAIWVSGDYPAGRADYPVTGVSWYEAAAYAEFAGKSLPTKDHWALAAGFDTSDLFVVFPNAIAPVSRFDKGGPAPVGSHKGMNCFGALDMAGNVREWCWNESPDGRFIRGGAWDDAVYTYTLESQQSPWNRSPQNGFRCVLYLDRDKVPATLFERKGLWRERDFRREKPVDDATFEIYKARFDYDPADLKAKVEKRDESAADWIVERVTFDAAYDHERVIAELYLPRNARPPYQSVILFPAADAVGGWLPASIRGYFGLGLDCFVKSGRAFVFPVYHGTYERTGDMTVLKRWPTEEYRHAYTDHLAKWVKDFRRCVDYLETRPDFDCQKIALCGASWGGIIGAIIPAVEPRVQAVMLVLGGLEANFALSEAQGLNYVSRITVPTLMLNGRRDMTFPLETCVRPAFNLLGTPEKDKRLVPYDTDHYVPKAELSQECLAWLNKYFGPAR